MGEFLFFAVIIFFSIIESIARKRKAEKAGESGSGPPPEVADELERRFAWANQPAEELPTYDSDPTYDSGPSYDSGRRYDGGSSDDDEVSDASEPLAARSSGAPPQGAMSPGDILAELSGLVGKFEAERSGARTLRVPDQSPLLPVLSSSRLPTPGASRLPVGSGPGGGPAPTIHSVHAGYGTDPSERARSEQDGLDPLRAVLSDDARAVRAQLTSHSASALRRALILREVLGPPVSLKDD